MMTFLVVADFKLNARLLDSRRLGKQRVEGYQILNAIARRGRGWQSHPAVTAWRFYPNALKYYINCIILEFIRRGYRNTMPLFELPPVILVPWWVQWDRLHQSHRAMLMRKAPHYYHDKFKVDPEYMNHGYIWINPLKGSNNPVVTPEDQDKPLAELASPIPKDLINPIYCSAVTRSGAICYGLVKNGTQVCQIHTRRPRASQ